MRSRRGKSKWRRALHSVRRTGEISGSAMVLYRGQRQLSSPNKGSNRQVKGLAGQGFHPHGRNISSLET